MGAIFPSRWTVLPELFRAKIRNRDFVKKEKFPDWQYWYEGISSDYGEFGWMEFDYGEELWYIEIDQGDWIVLPEKYDKSRLWYIQEQ